MCDFETNVSDPTSVWGWAACPISNPGMVRFGSSMEEFLLFAKGKANIYFHNLSFDGVFILDYLYNIGFTFSREPIPRSFNTLISRFGTWYKLSITFENGKTLNIKDSLKKLPMSVEAIAKAFNLPILKGTLDYETFRPPGHILTDEEKAYMQNDVQIVAMALKEQFDQGLKKLTIGSDALTHYKEMSDNFEKYFPLIPPEIDEIIRKSYKGGWVYLNPEYSGIDVASGITLDVNSLYPYIMDQRLLPYGPPIYFKGRYNTDTSHPLYVICISADFTLKPGYLPTIQGRGHSRFVPTEYIRDSSGSLHLYLTNIDYELFLKHYEVHELHHHYGFKFSAIQGIFSEYIKYWGDIKANSTGGKRQLAKLMLNSLYGKFGKNPDVTQKIPVYKDGRVSFVLDNPSYDNPMYIPMGSFITAYSRQYTITGAQNNYDRFIYADTDSLHLAGSDIPSGLKVDDKELGAWKIEQKFVRARFIRAKRYIEYPEYVEYGPNRPTIACAGLPYKARAQVNWNNFKPGNEYKGKLVKRVVQGGCYLKPTTFRME